MTALKKELGSMKHGHS